MLGLAYIIFLLTVIGVLLLLKAKISTSYSLVYERRARLEDRNRDMISEEKRIVGENLRREDAALKTMNLYEITKEVCEFLEEEKIFFSFKKGLSKFIHFEECSYLKSIDSNDDLLGFDIIPLASRRKNYGYLAIKGLKEEEKPVLDVLAAQFLVGIKRAQLYELVQKLSITDELTKTFTRRHFFVRFNEEFKRSADLSLSLSFLMIDIDNFKSFNDKYGHLVGDVILKHIADIIRSNCREIDLIGRFGGEEFAVALPMTSKDGALFAAERIRKSVESAQIKAFDETLNVTISIGVSNFSQDAKANQELIDKADWALYRSKQTGKNKVSIYARYK